MKNVEYTIVDKHRVQCAPLVRESKYGREYHRLDAPFGYKKNVEPHGDCIIYSMPGYAGTDRYATVQRPVSDPLVAYRCFRLTAE